MKKTLLLGLLCLTSCNDFFHTKAKEVTTNKIPWDRVTEYQYKGHDYIKWEMWTSETHCAIPEHSRECSHPLCTKIRESLLNSNNNEYIKDKMEEL